MHAEALSNAILSDELLQSESDQSLNPGAVPAVANSLDRFGAGYQHGRLVDWANGAAKSGGNPPKYLLSDAVRRGDGVGPVAALDEYCSKLLVVTLDITHVVERTGLTVSVWGSPDQAEWGAKPLVTFRQRQYCGVYSVLLNLATYPEIRYVRVQWSMNRWGKTVRTPLFGFEVFAQESGARISNSALA